MLLFAFCALFMIAIGRGVWQVSGCSSAVKCNASVLMDGREHLDADQFSERCFSPELREIAAGVWKDLESVLIVDVTRVCPQDRLIADLGLGKVDGLDAYHLAEDLKSRFDISILDLLQQGDPSVRDVILYIARSKAPNHGMHWGGGHRGS